MSDLFRAVQETLRGHKARGVDLTNPMGVEVFEKLYPAMEKGMMVHEYFDGFRLDHNSAFYSIPLENGFRVQGHSSGLRYHEALTNKLLHPNIQTHESHPATRYGWDYADFEANAPFNDHRIGHDVKVGQTTHHAVPFDDAGNTSPKHKEYFHEIMKKWAKEPTKGINYNWERPVAPMSSEEHREHQHNVKSGLLPQPNKIVVIQHKIHARDNERGYVHHEYDLRTEELKPHDPHKLRFGS